MKAGVAEKKISRLLRTLGQPARLQILLAIGEGEACVCHLEAVLGLRQAYISQHLMALRMAKVLQTRREGRFIFYQLQDLNMLDLIRRAGEIMGVAETVQPPPLGEDLAPACVCPFCAPGV